MAALGVVASVISAVGGIASGIAQNNAAQFEAQQQEAQGKEDFAASQRQAEQQRKEAQLVQSRQQALAAASGAGAQDPTIVRLMSQTAGQGELNAQSSLYTGEQQKRGLFDQAKGTRMTGQANMIGSFLGGAGDLFSGFAKYGPSTFGYK
jgi:hypothetical protein